MRQHGEYWGMLGLGDVALAQGDLAVALILYNPASKIAEAAARAEPNNAGWQRDLSVSYKRVGDVLVAQGNLAEALEELQGQPRHARASRQGRPHQRRMAARSFRLL